VIDDRQAASCAGKKRFASPQLAREVARKYAHGRQGRRRHGRAPEAYRASTGGAVTVDKLVRVLINIMTARDSPVMVSAGEREGLALALSVAKICAPDEHAEAEAVYRRSFRRDRKRV
jgi:hypothetical protein